MKTSNAMHTYMCDNDESWILVRAAGELLDFDTEQVVGDYTTDFSSGYPVINFTLLNSAADAAESGSLTSSVSGKLPSTFNFLCLSNPSLSLDPRLMMMMQNPKAKTMHACMHDCWV